MSDALLPPNASRLERGIGLAMDRLSRVPVVVREMWDPATCPVGHLPWLAWAFSVDDWDSEWPADTKRAVIQASYEVHAHKGTVAALRTAIDALGYGIELTEWFQESPPATPYTFGLTAELDGRGIAPGLWDEIERAAIEAKNVRSHLRYVRLRSTLRGRFYVGGTTISAEIVAVEPYALRELETRGPMFIGAACIAYETVEIFPRGAPVLAFVDGPHLTLTDGAELRLASMQ